MWHGGKYTSDGKAKELATLEHRAHDSRGFMDSQSLCSTVTRTEINTLISPWQVNLWLHWLRPGTLWDLTVPLTAALNGEGVSGNRHTQS